MHVTHTYKKLGHRWLEVHLRQIDDDWYFQIRFIESSQDMVIGEWNPPQRFQTTQVLETSQPFSLDGSTSVINTPRKQCLLAAKKRLKVWNSFTNYDPGHTIFWPYQEEVPW